MLLPTNAQGTGFLLNTKQHCFQGKGEREETVQLRCLEKYSPSYNFFNSFVQDCRARDKNQRRPISLEEKLKFYTGGEKKGKC